MLGTSISSLAYPLVILDATGSAAKAGIVTSTLAATTFVLRLPGGVLVDLWSRRRILLLCDAGRALAVASLALTLALGHLVLAQIVLVAIVEAALGVLFGPSEVAAVRRVVEPGQIRDAIARNQTRSQLAGLVGPPVGGALLGLGRSLPFVADAVSYTVSFVSILSVRKPLDDAPHARERRHLAAEVLDGLRWLWERPFLRALALWLSAGGIAFSSIGLVILVTAREHGATSAQIGVLFALTSGGGFAGSLATPWLMRAVSAPRLIAAFGWSVALATLLLIPTHSPYLLGLLGAFAFFLAPTVTAILFAAIAAEAPDRMQGRVNSAAIQLVSLLAPVGPLVGGLLLEALDPTGTLLVYGALMIALAVVATVARPLRAGAATPRSTA